ncbi:hypothetical protein [Actinomadura sp. DC4]|uniref:hypothetical protein n=1 Tax=Actinomadura sp. DC4 TaxID=3055069 RepID=UPI0025B23883|nr:hypothetical protein [Actinomadura sp. DC4]MDN3358801.1 hypothetical protein [Actinomadura sp. DC4]
MSAEKLRSKAASHIGVAEAHTEAGRYGPALSENISAARVVRRLLKTEPDSRRHRAVLGSLYYNRALLLERVGRGPDAITAGRWSVAFYEFLDPTLRGERSVADAVRDAPPVSGAAEPIDAAQLIAHLADAQARLARLLGTYGLRDRRRDRELRRFNRDPELTLRHEINVLDSQACLTYKALIGCSSYTEADFQRVLRQSGEGLTKYHARFPD